MDYLKIGRRSSSRGLDELFSRIEDAKGSFQKCLDYVRAKSWLNPSNSKDEIDIGYRDLVAKNMVDMGAEIYMAYLLLEEAGMSDRKRIVAKRYVNNLLPRIEMNQTVILGGDRTPLDQFDRIIYSKN
jgi:hypothetical protein